MNFFQKNSWFSTSVATITIVVLVFSSFAYLAYPKKAEAVVPTACFIPLDFDCLKESILDLVFKVFVRTLIRGITNSIIGWIQGDDGRNVGFVGNIEQEFRRQVNIRGGEFLNQISGIDMCGDIGAFLQISLRTSSSYQQEFACSLTDIVDNVESFFDDFSQGGWPAFISLTHDHQNNPYGAFLAASNRKVRVEAELAASQFITLLTGNGFTGVRKKIDTKCEKGNDKSLQCQTEYLIKTPGRLVFDMLSHGVLTDARALEVADEIDEAVGAIASAMINKIIGSVKDGIFDSGLSDLPANDDDEKDGLTITSPGKLPSGQNGTPYSFQFGVRNGFTPYRWSVKTTTVGNLPPGISLSENGLLSGTPTTEGTYSVLIEVTDRTQNIDLRQFTIEIKTSAKSTPP